MECNVAQEVQLANSMNPYYARGSKDEGPLCSVASSSLPFATTHKRTSLSNLDPSTAQLVQPSIPFSLMIPAVSPPHFRSSHGNYTISDFFLPANACTALDHDPASSSSVPTSYNSPFSDTNSLWPQSIAPHTPAFLDCSPLLSSAASNSPQEAGLFCDETSSLPHAIGAASYDPSLTYFFQYNSVHGHHISGVPGTGSYVPHYSGSSPLDSAAYSSADNCQYHNNAARLASVGFALPASCGTLYPPTLDGRAHNEHDFLQHEQIKDCAAHGAESEVLKERRLAIGNASADTDHRHQQYVHTLQITGHPCSLPLIDSSHFPIGNPNAKSPVEDQIPLKGLHQDRADFVDTTSNCSSKPTKKRHTPHQEGPESWPSAAAKECSPPLKMMRSPSLSPVATTTCSSAADVIHTQNISPTVNKSYDVKGLIGTAAGTTCNATTLSPSSQNCTVNPSASPANQAHDHSQKKSKKASTRQSVCNDPQSVAARHRRERISARLKALQQLVPNGSKLDLVTMLEKAISYVKSLQLQLKVLSTDEYWPTPLSNKHYLNNPATIAKLAASNYS